MKALEGDFRSRETQIRDSGRVVRIPSVHVGVALELVVKGLIWRPQLSGKRRKEVACEVPFLAQVVSFRKMEVDHQRP